MADGIPCRYCGHQEGAHDDLERHGDDAGREDCLNDIEGSREVAQGYSVNLEQCKGYEPQDAVEAERLKAIEQKDKAKLSMPIQGWRQDQER